jgi:hypothetical protein
MRALQRHWRGASPLRSTKEDQMRRSFLLLAALGSTIASWNVAFATWSVIAADQTTGRVAIAAATCVDQDDPSFLKSVQAIVVPGKGIAAAQAAVDRTHKNQMFIYEQMQQGTEPAAILEQLSRDEPLYQTRQFGIVDLRGRVAGHSGIGNLYVAQDRQGQVPGTGIYYSIQGNILRPGEVVPNAVQALIHTDGALTDRVMAAMDAADGSGGDSRCNCPPWPTDGTKPPIPCNNRTSYIAYILMATPNEKTLNSHNEGNYSLYLPVISPGSNHGPDQIHVGEDLNPVKTLRMRYDKWRKKQPASYK